MVGLHLLYCELSAGRSRFEPCAPPRKPHRLPRRVGGDVAATDARVDKLWHAQAKSIAASVEPGFQIGLEEEATVVHEADVYLLDFYDCLNTDEKITSTLRTLAWRAPERGRAMSDLGSGW